MKLNLSEQIATHLREVYFGGNWTDANLKDAIRGVDWEMATTQVYSFNTIVALVYHMNYYCVVVTKVLRGGPLEGKDTVSYDHPPIDSQKDWDQMLDKAWSDAEIFASLIEKLPGSAFGEVFVEEKHGIYYRNLQGIIEHFHYHLGQIVLIRKILLHSKED